MLLVSRLARRTGAPVVFSFAERLGHGRGYRAHWIPAPEGIADADPVVAATALNQGVESCVRRCPEQYQWSYKRFKLRPGGGGPKRYTGPR
jgi:KDO2-lipid IV(A) lauroyltransferase